MREIIIKGLRQNNLKNIDISLPLEKAVIITGPSGSGKSSLAFETLYAEGQRRYIQSLSTYARQFLEKMRAPDVDKIENILPSIALEQHNPVRNSRATVATSTEIYDYLRLLFEKVGIEYCAACEVPMERLTYEVFFERVLSACESQSVALAFEKTLPNDPAEAEEILRELLKSGYTRIIYDEKVFLLEEILKETFRPKVCFVVVDRIRLRESEKEGILTRFTEGLRSAVMLSGKDLASVFVEAEKKYSLVEEFTLLNRCPRCKKMTPPKSAVVFSFNSPLGACERCKGFGNTLEVDEDLVIPNPNLSIVRGAIEPFTKPSMNSWYKKLLAFCESSRIDIDLPYKDHSAEIKKMILDGSKGFKGVRGVFRMLEEEKYKLRIRVFVSRYTSPFTCPVCSGSRLSQSALSVRIGNLNIAAASQLNLSEFHHYLKNLNFTAREKHITQDVCRQLERRMENLITVGLGYLNLSRLTRSLSGGEYQRILLATQLSQGLTDTLYVLDEPSIGLHPKDTDQLLKVLNQLREQGNSLVLVEHDPEMIEWGDHIVDLGPGSGKRGGLVQFSGPLNRFLESDTQSAKAVKDWRKECFEQLKKNQSFSAAAWLEIQGAHSNNLKDIDVSIPLNRLVCITGVSGSGKSTLVVDTIFQALAKIYLGRSEKIGHFRAISGFENLSSVELVDQSPIGKSSRSNPITFIKGYDEIRLLFSHTREALAKRFGPGHFSFNVAGGRCDKCEGEGRIRIDMVFLEDVWVPCETCDEKRFKPAVLKVLFHGKNIDDVLRMTVDEAYLFFQGIPNLKSKLGLLQEVGLGYLQLGQSGHSLSGGEAQRLKIARELTLGGGAKRPPTLFILDEPTTGLHFSEISKLIQVLRRLLTNRHSVMVIEHNLQLISNSDYLIDLGPDGGEQGGYVVAAGTPYQVAERKLPIRDCIFLRF